MSGWIESFAVDGAEQQALGSAFANVTMGRALKSVEALVVGMAAAVPRSQRFARDVGNHEPYTCVGTDDV